MTKYKVRLEGTITVDANNEKDAIEIASEKSLLLWDWERPYVDE